MDVRPIIFSRTAATVDWQCRMKRFWNFEFAGRGLTAPELPYELYLGQLVHDGVAAMAHNVPIDEIVKAGITQLKAKLLEGLMPDGSPRELNSDAQLFADEQCALAEGMLRGFYRVCWPGICVEYPEVVMVERELVYDYEVDGHLLRFLSKPDLVRRAKDGSIWVLELKTTGSNKEEWIKQWTTAVQVHAQLKAVERALGEEPAGCIVQGFYKGYLDRRYGRWESPFCYAYHSPGNPPFEKPKWALEYKYGLKKHPLWLKDGGVKQWINEMPLPMLASQFPRTPPIFIQERLIEEFFLQQGLREIEIKKHRAEHRQDGPLPLSFHRTFPKQFESCNAYSRVCQYKRLCFGAPVDPLTIGYTQRYSHHPLEEEALRNEEVSK